MISAIVLAAGRSERMGTDKLLLPLGGKPVIARIVDELQRSSLHETIVVIGRNGEKVQHALQDRAVTFVANPNFASDMLGSIRCGLQVVSMSISSVLIVLGDQPNVTAQLVSELLESSRKSGRGIVVPARNGHRGHPVLIAARFRNELLAQHEGVGLQGLLDAHPEEVLRLEIADAALLEDMDTPADYRRQLNSPTR